MEDNKQTAERHSTRVALSNWRVHSDLLGSRHAHIILMHMNLPCGHALYVCANAADSSSSFNEKFLFKFLRICTCFGRCGCSQAHSSGFVRWASIVLGYWSGGIVKSHPEARRFNSFVIGSIQESITCVYYS